MNTVKTILRLMATCIAGFFAVWPGGMMANAIASRLHVGYDAEKAVGFACCLFAGAGASLLVCILLVPTRGLSLRRRVLCILLSPALATLGFGLILIFMYAVPPIDMFTVLFLWVLIVPGCSFLGYHLPLLLWTKRGVSISALENKGLGGPGVFVARIPPRLSTEQELFTALKTALRLPPDFGHDWDALAECLRDLSWIKERRVVLVHDDLPPLERTAMRTYLGLLNDSAAAGKPAQEHELQVVFPQGLEQEVRGILNGP